MVAQIIGHRTLHMILIDRASHIRELNADIQKADHRRTDQKSFCQMRPLRSQTQESPRQNWQAECEQKQTITRKDDWLLMGQIRNQQQGAEGKKEDRRRQYQSRFFGIYLPEARPKLLQNEPPCDAAPDQNYD